MQPCRRFSPLTWYVQTVDYEGSAIHVHHESVQGAASNFLRAGGIGFSDSFAGWLTAFLTYAGIVLALRLLQLLESSHTAVALFTMLPYELFTVVLLATRATAMPQAQNATVTGSLSFSDSSKWKVHPESTADGWDKPIETGSGPFADSCGSPNGCHIFTIHIETTATGWESVTSAVFESSEGSQTSQAPRVELIPTSTPSLVNIHTEIQTSAQQGMERPGDMLRSTPTPAENIPGSSSPQATSTSDSLLLDIISRIGIPTSSTAGGPNPNNDQVPTPSETNLGNESGPAQTDASLQTHKPPDANPGTTITLPSSVPTITTGGQITLGSAILTLTPGLSFVLGDGTGATYVAITTDDAGQTLITVSSSGTAVTATVTNAPATVTRSKMGLDTSITTAARPGNIDGMRSSDAAAISSSKGAAPSQRANVGQWLYVGMGLAGLGMVVG